MKTKVFICLLILSLSFSGCGLCVASDKQDSPPIEEVDDTQS